VPHEVIDRARRRSFSLIRPDLWLPLRLEPAKTDSATLDYQTIARLRDGISLDAAEASARCSLCGRFRAG
jgi:hypothetical protein